MAQTKTPAEIAAEEYISEQSKKILVTKNGGHDKTLFSFGLDMYNAGWKAHEAFIKNAQLKEEQKKNDYRTGKDAELNKNF